MSSNADPWAIKCDEGRPTCRACFLRKETCVYVDVPPAKSAPVPVAHAKKRSSTSSKARRRPTTNTDSAESTPDGLCSVVSEPLFRPSGFADETDMRMLWSYTAEAYKSFAVVGTYTMNVGNVLKVRLVEHAFQSPFPMQAIMGLAALQLRHLNKGVPTARYLAYHSQAYAGYRAAIERADPHDFPALLACSLLMPRLPASYLGIPRWNEST